MRRGEQSRAFLLGARLAQGGLCCCKKSSFQVVKNKCCWTYIVQCLFSLGCLRKKVRGSYCTHDDEQRARSFRTSQTNQIFCVSCSHNSLRLQRDVKKAAKGRRKSAGGGEQSTQEKRKAVTPGKATATQQTAKKAKGAANASAQQRELRTTCDRCKRRKVRRARRKKQHSMYEHAEIEPTFAPNARMVAPFVQILVTTPNPSQRKWAHHTLYSYVANTDTRSTYSLLSPYGLIVPTVPSLLPPLPRFTSILPPRTCGSLYFLTEGVLLRQPTMHRVRQEGGGLHIQAEGGARAQEGRRGKLCRDGFQLE